MIAFRNRPQTIENQWFHCKFFLEPLKNGWLHCKLFPKPLINQWFHCKRLPKPLGKHWFLCVFFKTFEKPMTSWHNYTRTIEKNVFQGKYSQFNLAVYNNITSFQNVGVQCKRSMSVAFTAQRKTHVEILDSGGGRWHAGGGLDHAFVLSSSMCENPLSRLWGMGRADSKIRVIYKNVFSFRFKPQPASSNIQNMRIRPKVVE